MLTARSRAVQCATALRLTLFAPRRWIFSGKAPPGLFGIGRLQAPSDYVRWAAAAQETCRDLMRQVEQAPRDVRVVQLMDDISDEMCRVYDSAECCRHVHTDRQWRAAATQVCQTLADFISEVNHHEGIYAALRTTMQRLQATPPPPAHGGSGGAAAAAEAGRAAAPLSRAEAAAFTPEAALVGAKLLQDMAKAGVGLPNGPARRRLQQLLAEGSHYPAQFNRALTDPQQLGIAGVDASLLPPAWRSQRSGRRVDVPLDGPTMHHFLSGVPSERARKQVYMEGYSRPQANLTLLDGIIDTRHATATTLGARSYAHWKAEDGSLAATPEAVTAFLLQTAEGLRPAADAEVAALGRLKRRHHSALEGAAPAMPWDVDYLQRAARAALCPTPHAAVRRYLSLDSVLAGVSELMERLMGLALVETPLGRGEGWAPGVRRLEARAVREGGAPLGVLYLDLQPRPGKAPGSVLFPVRCGRGLPGGAYQQPILVLVSSFGEEGGATVLSWRELRTLVHELGHACHSLLCTTHYQHLWGTRCAQDVVEIPSHLWEHFVGDYRTASLLARDASSRAPLPRALHSELVAASNLFPALDLQHQVLLAMVDQAYFGPDQPPPGGTSAVWERLARSYSSVPHAPGTCVQARFSHLTIYGASYYSYIYARCLSAALWEQYLAHDPLDREAGEQLRAQLLSPGGSVEPLELVRGALGTGAPAALQHLAGGWAPRPEQLLESVAVASRGRGASL